MLTRPASSSSRMLVSVEKGRGRTESAKRAYLSLLVCCSSSRRTPSRRRLLVQCSAKRAAEIYSRFLAHELIDDDSLSDVVKHPAHALHELLGRLQALHRRRARHCPRFDEARRRLPLYTSTTVSMCSDLDYVTEVPLDDEQGKRQKSKHKSQMNRALLHLSQPVPQHVYYPCRQVVSRRGTTSWTSSASNRIATVRSRSSSRRPAEALPHAKSPFIVFSDFDGTITTEDSNDAATDNVRVSHESPSPELTRVYFHSSDSAQTSVAPSMSRS